MHTLERPLKVTLPGLKRSALSAHQELGTPIDFPTTPNTNAPLSFVCTSDGCGDAACYGYIDAQPSKCLAHRFEGMVEFAGV